jgi:predicted ATP-grasp superfamily ATP-dependent carboligase
VFAQHTILPFEDYSKMIKLHDKGKLSEVAEELNIPIPKTYNITSFEEIEKVSHKLDFPVVIKLKNSTSSKGIEYVYSQKEFISKYKETVSKLKLDLVDYPLVQEYIPGEGYGVSLLMNHGDLRAIFTHRRLREYPITGGPSTLRESVRHPEMEKIAIKLMKYFDWHGVAMVEFKLNRYTNKPVLIEVNPRFWGSLNQAIYSGVDFPFLLYKMAIEGDVKPVLEYKVGVKTRILMNDFRSILSQLKYSNNRTQTIKETLKTGGIHDDIISYADPLPSILFTYTNIKKSLIEKGNYE